jgi:hypothetical protein
MILCLIWLGYLYQIGWGQDYIFLTQRCAEGNAEVRGVLRGGYLFIQLQPKLILQFKLKVLTILAI